MLDRFFAVSAFASQFTAGSRWGGISCGARRDGVRCARLGMLENLSMRSPDHAKTSVTPSIARGRPFPNGNPGRKPETKGMSGRTSLRQNSFRKCVAAVCFVD